MHKTSDHLKDRLPYVDPSFVDKLEAIDALMTWGHGPEGILRAFSLLLRGDVEVEEKVKGMRVLCTLTREPQEKLRLMALGVVKVLVPVLLDHRYDFDLCALCFEALADFALLTAASEQFKAHDCIPVMLSAFAHSRDAPYLRSLALFFDNLTRTTEGSELLASYADGASGSGGAIEILTDNLRLPLIDRVAAMRLLSALERLARLRHAHEEMIRHHSIPVAVGVLQFAYDSDDCELALTAVEMVWTACLDSNGKEVAAVSPTLALLACTSLLALTHGEKHVDLQRASLGAMSTILIHLNAKAAAAEFADIVLSPVVEYLLRRVGSRLRPADEQDHRDDCIANAIRCLRVASEHPLAKEHVCELLQNEQLLLRAVYGSTDLLHTYNSADRDKVPKSVRHVLAPAARS